MLGLGNILLRDEGVGVHAVRRLLAEYSIPAEVEVVDGGTLGLDLLPYLESAERLLVLDAVRAGRPPGTLIRLEGDEIPGALGAKISPHQMGLVDLLAAGRLTDCLPERVVLWGMQPGVLEPGLELTPAVASRLSELVELSIVELQSWGVEIRPLGHE